MLCNELLKKPHMINYFYSSDFFFNSILPSITSNKLKYNYIASIKTSRYLLNNLVSLYNISDLNNTNYINGLLKQLDILELFIMELESLNFSNNHPNKSKS